MHKGRIDLVEEQFGSLEWESLIFRGTRPNNKNRCLPQRVESFMHGSNHRGEMVSSGTTPSYKLSGTVSWSICPQTFTKNKAQMRVRLLVGNTSAAHYINKMGGTRSLILASLAKNLWEWCLERQIVFEAQHISQEF